MSHNLIIPTKEEAKEYILFTFRHSYHVEYYLSRLGIDPEKHLPEPERQRPHDLCGERDKFDWPVMEGLALELRLVQMEQGLIEALAEYPAYAYLSALKNGERREALLSLEELALPQKRLAQQLKKAKITSARILISVNLHRQGQYHHKMWNGYEVNPQACDADLQLGAIDSITSNLEPRGYQGGVHTFTEIKELPRFKNNPPYKRQWLELMLEEMQRVEQPDLCRIVLPNPQNMYGIPKEMFEKMCLRAEAALRMVSALYL